MCVHLTLLGIPHMNSQLTGRQPPGKPENMNRNISTQLIFFMKIKLGNEAATKVSCQVAHLLSKWGKPFLPMVTWFNHVGLQQPKQCVQRWPCGRRGLLEQVKWRTTCTAVQQRAAGAHGAQTFTSRTAPERVWNVRVHVPRFSNRRTSLFHVHENTTRIVLFLSLFYKQESWRSEWFSDISKVT